MPELVQNDARQLVQDLYSLRLGGSDRILEVLYPLGQSASNIRQLSTPMLNMSVRAVWQIHFFFNICLR